MGVEDKHCRPYHPQTCGKVERFHQTLKKWLARQPRARTLAQLQDQLDRFRAYCNAVRPHRAIGRRIPAEAFSARTNAKPRAGVALAVQHRVRRDRIDRGGKVTLRYRSRLLHLGVGRRYAGTRVLLLVKDPRCQVINDDGELLAQFTIDPSRQYQTQQRLAPHA